MSKLLIIDDSDPAIVYMGNWATLTGVGATTGEYNSTVHQSGVAGDQLSYTFEGMTLGIAYAPCSIGIETSSAINFVY
jgi:hypothetical protein